MILARVRAGERGALFLRRRIDACLCADAPGGGNAHAADLSGDGACVGVGFQRCDDLGALLGRNKAPRFIRRSEVDACLSGDLTDGIAAYVAELPGDGPSVGVGFQRRDDPGALFGGTKRRSPIAAARRMPAFRAILQTVLQLTSPTCLATALALGLAFSAAMILARFSGGSFFILSGLAN